MFAAPDDVTPFTSSPLYVNLLLACALEKVASGGGADAGVEDVVAGREVRVADAEVDHVEIGVDVVARERGAELHRVRAGHDHRVRPSVGEAANRRISLVVVGDDVARRRAVRAGHTAAGEGDRVARDSS